jgi:hypothetical protein
MSSTPGRFLIGFILTLAIFVTANLLAAQVQSDCGLPAFFHMSGCADDIRRAGFPLQFYEEGGFAYHSSFDEGALALDLGIGLGLSGAAGLAMTMLWKKST